MSLRMWYRSYVSVLIMMLGVRGIAIAGGGRDHGCLGRDSAGCAEDWWARRLRASGSAKGAATRGCAMLARCDHARMADRRTLPEIPGGHCNGGRREARECGNL